MTAPTAATVVARRTSVSGSTSTAMPSITVTTAKKGHDTIQRARALRWRSGRDNCGGANQRRSDCGVNRVSA